jgi:hypothetical protein
MTALPDRRYWLMKSEPQACSIDDALAAPASTVPWVGVRNYQARNFMRDAMRPGDGVLFYHSSCAEPGIAELDDARGERALERLAVGVDRDEIHTLHAAADHVVDGIATGSTDTDHLDDCAIGLLIDHFETGHLLRASN